jgi:hypothetical protein
MLSDTGRTNELERETGLEPATMRPEGCRQGRDHIGIAATLWLRSGKPATAGCIVEASPTLG